MYDEWGRAVGVKRGDADWACTEFDDRDRVIKVTEPAYGTAPGRVLTNVYAGGNNPLIATTHDSLYSFDAAGRLVEAVIPHHTLSYDYTSTACGVNTDAGKNGNRVGFTDNFDGTITSVAYCYDHADRLTGTTVTNAPTGASPVAGGNLTITGPGETLAYDAHGNTTVLADQTLTYDVADRHVKTVLDDGTTITYTLDAGGRMVARTVANSPDSDEDGEIRYLASGGIADENGAVLQCVVSLPGGVTMTLDADGSQRWWFPNLHGDVIVATDGDGHRVGARSVYDPFGQPIDPDTWAIGTLAADDDIPDLLVGDADFGWVGQHSKFTEITGRSTPSPWVRPVTPHDPAGGRSGRPNSVSPLRSSTKPGTSRFRARWNNSTVDIGSWN